MNEQVIAVGPLGCCVDHVSEPFFMKGEDAAKSWVSLVEDVSRGHKLLT